MENSNNPTTTDIGESKSTYSPSKVKIAAIQTFSKFGEKENNIKNLERLIREGIERII